MVSHPSSSISFSPFNQPALEVYPYFGENIVLLLDEKHHELAQTDLNAIDCIVSTYDKCFEFYQSCFDGDRPSSSSSYTMDGRATICVISNGAGGLGIVGGLGVEIGPAFFETTFKNVKYGLSENYYHVLFYEFGRNWWLTSDSLTCSGHSLCNSSFIDGYAIFMQIWAMKYCGISGGFYSGQPFSVHNLKLLAHVSNYEQNTQANWNNTLVLKRGADFAEHYGCELWAGFMHYMSLRLGGLTFVQRIFRHAKKLSKPSSTQDVLDNWFISASRAAQKNLGPLFNKRWRMNVSSWAIELIQNEFRTTYEYDSIERSSNSHSSQLCIVNQHVCDESLVKSFKEYSNEDESLILIGFNVWTGHIIDSLQPIYGRINTQNGQVEYVREGERYGSCGGKLERMEFKGHVPVAIHYENGLWYGNQVLCRIGIEFQEWNASLLRPCGQVTTFYWALGSDNTKKVIDVSMDTEDIMADKLQPAMTTIRLNVSSKEVFVGFAGEGSIGSKLNTFTPMIGSLRR